MERRRLGRTGHESAVAILGAAAFARATPEETEAGFSEALRRGVNHLDIAPRYGAAEDLVGPLLPPVRDQLFVGCKTTRRNREGVRAQLEESLRKLGTDHFDLYQMHAVTDLDVLAERTEAAQEILRAREEGLTRFVGITGHNDGAPAAHLEALRRWDLDTVMFPVNARMWSDPDYRRDAEALLDECAGRDVGVMAIKAAARRPWSVGSGVSPDDRGERFATTWYEPFTDAADVARGVAFTLSVPGVHGFCTPGDLRVLRLALDAAEAFDPLGPDERESAIADARALPSIFPLPA
jgi:aryl-alcohol dehydrogenase-like predicted oxidoreductase